MKKLLVLLTFLASTAFAQSLPSYYPSDGFSRSGIIDAVYLDEGRIVINDIPYRMNSRPIVRSL